MVATRSDCLARGNVAANTQVSAYTSPPGFTTIVKSVLIAQSFNAAYYVLVLVQAATGGIFLGMANFTSSSLGAAERSTWVVLRPGDSLLVNAQAGAASYWISGAVLPDSGP